jgi:TolB-like protein/tetratricopeptide (TPR) repeat protein
MRPFLAELRRRNVYKVAVAYAVVAWLALQAASFLLPSFGAPAWVFRVLVLLVVLGFALAVAFSWAFELTPEGLKRTHEVPHEHSITHLTGRKLDFAIIGLLIVALGTSVYLNLRKAPRSARSASIAVLPFTSRSVDPAHAMFADGIHDELLTSLANIGSLKVISRTSVMEYRNSTKNLRQIGKELAVATVLEGAVQRAGDNVRINVQLIDAATDEHLWANTYDRRLSPDNLFAIQTEIATTIADKLKATLTPDEKQRIARVPTENLQAYNLYLAGRQNFHTRKLENLHRARELFEQAIELDPKFAKAYSGLSDTLNILYVNFDELEPNEFFSRSAGLLDKALALDTEDADIYASLGLLKNSRWNTTQQPVDLEQSDEAFERAITLNPNHAQAVAWYAASKLDNGDYSQAIKLFERSLELDPLGRITKTNLAQSYTGLGQNRKALDVWLESARMNPDWPTAPESIGQHLGSLGRLDESLAWAYKAVALSEDPSSVRGVSATLAALGQTARAAEVARQIPRDHPLWVQRQAFARRLEGDPAGALAMLEAAIQKSEITPVPVLRVGADLALLQGKFAEARGWLERLCPQMLDARPRFDDWGICSGVGYAYVLRGLGDREQSAKVLDAYLNYVSRRPRLGFLGFGIGDVEALALSGKREEALGRLRDAVDAGWRSSNSPLRWNLVEDPYLKSLHDDGRFRVIVAEVDADIARMRERAAQAEANGDWQPLLALAAHGEGRVAPAANN